MAEYLLPLEDRHDVAEGTMAFRFGTGGTGLSFKAGQHATFTLIDPPQSDAQGNTRTFSIASSPDDRDALMIATRMRNTTFKNNLKTVPLGTRVQVRGPMGAFTLHKDVARPAVLVAGGIGITAMRAMIEYATHVKAPHRLLLLYSDRTRARVAFLDDLERWARENPNFELVATITDVHDPAWRHKVGGIDRHLLTKYVPDARPAIYYLAGPPGMVEAMRTLLDGLGVGDDDIRAEEFAGY